MKQLQLQEITDNSKTVIKKDNIEIVKSTIKPYTESQLSALYHNSELNTLDAFITQYVEAELKGKLIDILATLTYIITMLSVVVTLIYSIGLAIKQHILYELLINYLRVREKITGNNLELDQIRKEYLKLQQDLWTIEKAVVNGRSECQDGTVVMASHSYNKSIFHRSVFQNIIKILSNVQKLTYETHTLFTYTAEDLKMQVSDISH